MLKPLLAAAALVAAIITGRCLNRPRRVQVPSAGDASSESCEEERRYDTDDLLMR